MNLEIVVPFFNSSIYYDPDFSVTLFGGGGTSGGGDGSGSNLLPLISLVVLVPVCFVGLLVVVLGVLFQWLRKRRIRHLHKDAVNL